MKARKPLIAGNWKMNSTTGYARLTRIRNVELKFHGTIK
jgi:triosephosphate isomerase